MKRTTKPDWQQRIARERIEILFALAEKNFSKNLERSRRYVELARKIGLRYNVRLTKEQKNSFCKNCNTLLKKGKSAQHTVDGKNKVVLIKCLNCNKIYRKPYKK